MNDKTLAGKWIDDEISLGKLLQELKLPRGGADDLAGMIRNEYEERSRWLLKNVVARRTRCEEWANDAKAEKKYHDAAAEMAKVNAYLALEHLIKFQFNINADTDPKAREGG